MLILFATNAIQEILRNASINISLWGLTRKPLTDIYVH